MLRCQRRAEPLPHRPAVLLPHPAQDFVPDPLRVPRVRPSPGVPVLQPPSPSLLIPFPQPLRLSVTPPQHPRRVHDPQLSTPHPRQYLNPSQLPLAHLGSPQSDLLSEVTLGDISIEDKRGHYHRGTTLESLTHVIDPFTAFPLTGRRHVDVLRLT